MSFKKTITGIEARNKLVEGADFLAAAVKPTIGPFGVNHCLEKGNKITNDGATIAREIEHKDEIVNRGITLLREAAIKTEAEAGDGTTTAITLAHAILKEAIKRLPREATAIGKMTPAELIRTLATESGEVIQQLKDMATPITTEAELIQSARVSVEDEELGKMIGSTQWELSAYGVILAEESNDIACSIERINGVRIDNGLGTTVVMNNLEAQSLETQEANIILTNHVVTSIIPLKPVYDALSQAGVRNLIIVARAFSEVAIKQCMQNIQGGFNIFPINAPYTDQNEIMQDLATITGGRYINLEDADLSEAQLSDVGTVSRVIAKRWDAIFTGLPTDKIKERVNKRVEELNKKLAGEASTFEKKNLESRISQLTNGFALMKVGSTSEIERKRIYDKVQDAVQAVRAAFQEGTVPGAGIAFKTISESLPDTYILKRPLMSVYEQIMSSAPQNFIIEDWVRDPVKVLRIALDKAVSVAGTIATANGVTAAEREKPRLVQEVTAPESVV